MPRRDPERAVQVLDLMLEFFGDGQRWITHHLGDGDGNRCVIGALGYIRQKHGIRGDGAGLYFQKALREQQYRFVTIAEFNDNAGSHEAVRRVLVRARMLAVKEVSATSRMLAA